MRIAWNGGGHRSSLAVIREQARRASTDGFASFWLSRIDLRVNTLCRSAEEDERMHALLRTLCRERNRHA